VLLVGPSRQPTSTDTGNEAVVAMARFQYFFSTAGTAYPKDMIEMGFYETTKQAVIAGLGLPLISAHRQEG